MTSRPPHPPTDRRRALRLLSIASLTPLMTAVAACGGGGGDAGGPAPVPTPPAPGVSGPAWWGFGRDAQHSALGAIATQNLNRIAWSTPVDLAPQYTGSGALLIHYGSPVVTALNTVIVPVKTDATGGFRFEARSGVNGGLIWSADSDYVLPAHNWVPSYNLALTPTNRVLAPGAGGKLLVRDNADAASGAVTTAVFYGAAAYNANPAAFDTTVFINTPITADAAGNVFFGFIVTGPNPAGLASGIARISAAGVGSWAAATTLAADPTIVKVTMNCAPAVSPDLATVYFAVNQAVVAGTVQAGYLIAVDATTLALRGKVALRDPIDGGPARLSDNGTASPTIGPDGEVFFGVLEGTFGTHNGRGWLLHFDATLALERPPGGFGWDDTASIVPRAMLPSYTGAASYLLMVKYNNYYGVGTGDGLNRVALIDPTAMQLEVDTNVLVMKEILAIVGPTFVSGNAGPVEEWCINTAAVDPVTRSILVNSEDGFLYRWSMLTNTFTQRIRLTSGIAESYTPTAIGADGAVYAINNAVLFSIAG
ncbi:MAG: hypothetical protein V4750_02960 [Pseudomonadota bacterium]